LFPGNGKYLSSWSGCIIDVMIQKGNAFAIAIFNKFKVEEPAFIEKINVLYKSGGMDYRF
jgi:hypothetical protein